MRRSRCGLFPKGLERTLRPQAWVSSVTRHVKARRGRGKRESRGSNAF